MQMKRGIGPLGLELNLFRGISSKNEIKIINQPEVPKNVIDVNNTSSKTLRC